MPTGYTAPVKDGEITDFAQFALRCARAFGALVDMRDAPMDAAVPEEIKPEPRYADRLAEAKRLLTEARSWDAATAERQAAKAHAKAIRIAEEINTENRAARARYEAMLARVLAWQPPTSEHAGLKEFMETQLRESIEHDCYEMDMPAPVSGETYRQQQIEEASSAIERAAKRHDEEIVRAIGRSEWLRELRDSLPGTGSNESEGAR